MLLEEALAASDKADGWLTRKEQTLLYNLAKEVPAGKAIFELGSWMGKATIMLAAGSMAGSKVPVYAVDYFTIAHGTGREYKPYIQPNTQEYLRFFSQNLCNAGLSCIVTPVTSSTVRAAEQWTGPEPYLIFIDADHRYGAVRKDFIAWIEHCGVGTKVVFHDFNLYANPGVFMFVNCISTTPILSHAGLVDSMWYGSVATKEVAAVKNRIGHTWCLTRALWRLGWKAASKLAHNCTSARKIPAE